MNSSTTLNEPRCDSGETAMTPFAPEGWLPAPVASYRTAREAMQALDDLLAVIDELCPIRPERPRFKAATDFRL
jgi:cytochrome c1